MMKYFIFIIILLVLTIILIIKMRPHKISDHKIDDIVKKNKELIKKAKKLLKKKD